MEFVAVGGTGLETLIEEEVRSFGGNDIRVEKGLIHWSGSLESGYRACLWSRYSSKILLVIQEYHVPDEDELYKSVRQFNWLDHFDERGTFAVDCSLSSDAPFNHSKYTSLRVKDGIVDYFRDTRGSRPSVKVNRPGVKVNIHADAFRTQICIDLSGESLHRRGYRAEGGEAPLKETLAAAIIKLSGWNGEVPLLDPMSGSGTLLIEAAMMYGDSAPGLGRKYFGMFGWRGHDVKLWNALVTEAIEREVAGRKKRWPKIRGYDGDQKAVRISRENIYNAGLDDLIKVSGREFFALQSLQEKGYLVTNPPYGERLSEKETVKYLYRSIGLRLKESFPGWEVALLTANPDMADMVGIPWASQHKLHNGSIPCRLYTGTVLPDTAQEFSWSIHHTEMIETGKDFANRLKKNLKKLTGWAQKEKIACYRVYDRDLPEYNVCIDLYGKWVHIQEFSAPNTIDEGLAAERFQTVLYVTRAVLGVGRDRVFIKRRKRQRGKKQYQKKTSGQGKLHVVEEGQGVFLVNFTDYLDTGLFLDHRNTRLRIAAESNGLRFLNLFGYTASASVHAILGGAVSSTTVDLSGPYLAWAAKNLALNGIYTQRHRLVKADCLDWLEKDRQTYDLIFVDPPTFSNTHKKARVFDVQKQHQLLINLAMKRLDETGVLLFSTNYKSFKLDEALQERYRCANISRKSVPNDFAKTPRVHQCWEIHHQ